MTTQPTTIPNTRQPLLPTDLSRVSFVDGRELKYPARLTKEGRFLLLKALVGRGYTDKQLAKLLKCTDRTVRNYKRELFKSEEYWVGVDEDIHALLHDPEISKYERLRSLIQLKKMRMMMVEVNKNIEGGSVTIQIIDDKQAP